VNPNPLVLCQRVTLGKSLGDSERCIHNKCIRYHDVAIVFLNIHNKCINNSMARCLVDSSSSCREEISALAMVVRVWVAMRSWLGDS
jgi:hypothetical protein